MPRNEQDLGFPLVFSQEDLSLLEGLVSRGHPLPRVLNIALLLHGVSKSRLAARMRVHPTFINHLFNSREISSAHRGRLMELGIPENVLPPARQDSDEAA